MGIIMCKWAEPAFQMLPDYYKKHPTKATRAQGGNGDSKRHSEILPGTVAVICCLLAITVSTSGAIAMGRQQLRLLVPCQIAAGVDPMSPNTLTTFIFPNVCKNSPQKQQEHKDPLTAATIPRRKEGIMWVKVLRMPMDGFADAWSLKATINQRLIPSIRVEKGWIEATRNPLLSPTNKMATINSSNSRNYKRLGNS